MISSKLIILIVQILLLDQSRWYRIARLNSNILIHSAQREHIKTVLSREFWDTRANQIIDSNLFLTSFFWNFQGYSSL